MLPPESAWLHELHRSSVAQFRSFPRQSPAGVQLFSLFKANPALLDLVATIHGQRARLAAHLARRSILLDSVLSPHFYLPLPSANS